jgi:hypothetical protein
MTVMHVLWGLTMGVTYGLFASWMYGIYKQVS